MKSESNGFRIKAYELPFDDEITEFWVVNNKITFEEEQDAPLLFEKPVFVAPGLVDAHVHLTIDFNNFNLNPASKELVQANRRAHLESGTLLLRDIGTVNESSTLNLARNDGLPIVHSAGSFLAPKYGYFDFIDPVKGENLEKRAVNQVKDGFQWVKIIIDFPKGGDFSNSQLNFAEENVHQTVKAVQKTGGRVGVHVTNKEGVRLAINSGVDTLEHGFNLSKNQLDQMAQKGIAWTPTLSIINLLKNYTGMDKQIPFILDNMKNLIPLANDHLTLLAGTDMLPHGSVGNEILKMYEFGLSVEDAIATATTIPRNYLGENGIEEGSDANLIFFLEDPRKNIEIIRKPPTKIMMHGKIVG
ncbi:MAG: amidohydrolase family protein [Candidatus Thorarchaeota archaeon]